MSITINGTTGIAGTNGSAGTPAVQGEDTNTGIFFPAADTVAVATAGTERLRVDSSGNLGLGTTSPQAYSGYTVATVDNATNGGLVSVRRAGTSLLNLYTAAGEGRVEAANSAILGFWTASAERARIDASGNLLVGATSFAGANGKISVLYTGGVDYAIKIKTTVANGGAVRFMNPSDGEVGTITQTNTATAYNTSSDYRLKENVAPMQNALDTVAQLNPVTYTWKADGSAGQGFIAHELQAVVPDCVTGEKDAVDAEGNPQYQGVDTSFLVATLVKAIQELTARVAQLEAQ